MNIFLITKIVIVFPKHVFLKTMQQNTRGCTKNIKSENPEISGRKIFCTTRPKVLATQTPVNDICVNIHSDIGNLPIRTLYYIYLSQIKG